MPGSAAGPARRALPWAESWPSPDVSWQPDRGKMGQIVVWGELVIGKARHFCRFVACFPLHIRGRPELPNAPFNAPGVANKRACTMMCIVPGDTYVEVYRRACPSVIAQDDLYHATSLHGVHVAMLLCIVQPSTW